MPLLVLDVVGVSILCLGGGEREMGEDVSGGGCRIVEHGGLERVDGLG